jgi:hypothetical protein
MRARCSILLLLTLGFSWDVEASDLSNALKMARDVMGEDIVEGYEQYIIEEPNEALSILLHRHGDPYYPSPDPARRRDRRAPFADLGKVRLGFDELAEPMRRASEATGLPVALIDAVVRTESGYRPHAVSRVGAQGLMQLMPKTAEAMGVTNAFDPADNVMGGARYLRKLYDKFGSLRLAIAAYNAGPHRVKQYGGIPPFSETQAYVKTVLRRYEDARDRGVR